MSTSFAAIDKMGFTPSQRDAVLALTKWYNSNELICTLRGHAGTGKTYILDYFVNQVIKHSVVVTAPTHKAVRIVEKRIGKKSKTLQSLHGLRVNVNLETFNIDKIQFDPFGEPSFANYKIVIIDECSMINSSLYDLNEQRARQYKTKILYVGDDKQLPPVGENLSRCFTCKNQVVLNEIVRQDKDNPMLTLLSLLRDDIEHGTSKFISHIVTNKEVINSKGEGYETLKTKPFTQKVVEVFNDKRFESNLDFVRYTAWTNKSIKEWNSFIRKKILPSSDNVVTIDDVFTGYKTIVDEFLKPIIINSEDYIVANVEYRRSDYGFFVYRTVLRNVYDNGTSAVEIVDHKHSSFIKYYNKLNNLHFEAIYSTAMERGRKWKEYYNFKDRYLCLVNFDLKDNGKSKSRGTVTRDIDYGFGLTTHKCQGSTYENIFINVQDIAYYNDGSSIRLINYDKNAILLRNKLLYVAASRASKKCYFLLNI